jgi:hypothetical protein
MSVYIPSLSQVTISLIVNYNPAKLKECHQIAFKSVIKLKVVWKDTAKAFIIPEGSHPKSYYSQRSFISRVGKI